MAPPQNSENEPFSKSSNSSSESLKKNFKILTLFPEVVRPYLDASLLGKAQKNGLIHVDLVQIRDFAKDKHRTVDDSPYGGGEGMVMRADVLYEAWKSVHTPQTRTILLSPQGNLFYSKMARNLAENAREDLILICGHYEGVDERFIEECVDEEISIGNYVLTGGELAALVVIDSVSRYLPGVVGQAASVEGDSLENGLLKYPQYTRPAEFRGRSVPAVLMSGNHGEIARIRHEWQLQRTRTKRPDLSSEMSSQNKKP